MLKRKITNLVEILQYHYFTNYSHTSLNNGGFISNIVGLYMYICLLTDKKGNALLSAIFRQNYSRNLYAKKNRRYSCYNYI